MFLKNIMKTSEKVLKLTKDDRATAMDIIKNLEDYIETGGQLDLANCLKCKLDTDTCVVEIKNKDYILQNCLGKNHNFVIYSTEEAFRSQNAIVNSTGLPFKDYTVA